MTIRQTILTICGLTMLAGSAHAQDTAEEAPPPAWPETEIFLFDYDADAEGDVLSGGANVTNRAGYDNQPYFTKDSATFLYSRDDGTQTDIWEYDIASGTHTKITNTPESEFSPTPSPDNQTISMVFERSNSIWQLSRETPDEPEKVLQPGVAIEPVGYFARNHDSGEIVFWSRFGFSIALAHDAKPDYFFVTGHAVPATPHLIPGTNLFSFVHRQTNEQVWIKALDPVTAAVRPITPIVGTNANYTWAPDGSILQIEDGVLHRWRDNGEGWQEISDLTVHGLADANRIDVSPDGKRIAIVGLPSD